MTISGSIGYAATSAAPGIPSHVAQNRPNHAAMEPTASSEYRRSFLDRPIASAILR